MKSLMNRARDRKGAYEGKGGLAFTALCLLHVEEKQFPRHFVATA